MTFKSVPDYRWVDHGFGWRKTKTWRVQHRIGNITFLTRRSYPTEEAAKRAARNLNKKANHEEATDQAPTLDVGGSLPPQALSQSQEP